MKLYSTNNINNIVELKEAVFKGLPEDNGLYMPVNIPVLPDAFINNLNSFSFSEIAFEITKNLFKGYISEEDITSIIENSITFPAPIVSLSKDTHILELFHGPSLAFKDFGARFMAQLMSHFNKEETKELVILVATSGDTGGAVAAGFYKTPGIKVIILYPSGKVSPLQEKQLTTLGHNISALEVDGTFDDCQALVKKAFLDQELRSQIRISSANSINISRLIPQSFYYFEAFKQLENKENVSFVIPSGNFGNLTAGLFAHKMGLPVHQFIAATNLNNIVPSYLNSGEYNPKPSVRTISNAMDVGNPSNFARMKDIFSQALTDDGFTWNNMKTMIKGFSFDDAQTKEAVKEVYETYNYTIDPHGAIGYLAFKEYKKSNPNANGVILETAHPSKFLADMESILNKKIDIPERLAKLSNETKIANFINTEYDPFKKLLLDKYC